ncbi:MAG TPA: T9SS type A sorting domain-containing protein, partial [Bacteroidia bacterium]|nr:T9SS type A sorting domain-containing protein [Bacteroidia bacterium]
NPSNGQFTVTLDQPVAKISVINILGEVVYTSGAAESTTAVVTLPADSKPGVYIIQTEAANGTGTTHKIIVQ